MIVPAGAYLEDGYREGLEFVRQNRERLPTAITCYNDLVALGLMRALAELGVRVPDEVSVIGYDDIDILDYLPLPLTSVRVPKHEMGRMAAEMLIEHIESNKKPPPRKIYLEAELVIRKSTRAIAQQRAEQKMPST
jgi:DNA-binding LacI/PurR family transcriptional regulator